MKDTFLTVITFLLFVVCGTGLLAACFDVLFF